MRKRPPRRPPKKVRPTRNPTPREIQKAAKENWLKGRKAEKAYQRQLTSIGEQVGQIVKAFAPSGTVENMAKLTETLHKYSELIEPWAAMVTERMHLDVERRDKDAWVQAAREMGKTLRKDLFTQNKVSETMRTAMSIQVKLIKSLPIEAAERVHRIALEQLVNAGRADELKKEILRSGHVTEGRARTIARTETARTASLLMESRAIFVGSTHYRWETSRDEDVRKEHRKLQGKVFSWKEPPVAGSRGERAHPGQIYNCRCYAAPILPE